VKEIAGNLLSTIPSGNCQFNKGQTKSQVDFKNLFKIKICASVLFQNLDFASLVKNFKMQCESFTFYKNTFCECIFFFKPQQERLVFQNPQNIAF